MCAERMTSHEKLYTYFAPSSVEAKMDKARRLRAAALGRYAFWPVGISFVITMVILIGVATVHTSERRTLAYTLPIAGSNWEAPEISGVTGRTTGGANCR